MSWHRVVTLSGLTSRPLCWHGAEAMSESRRSRTPAAVKRFGDAVREAREAKGWSQIRLADTVGLSNDIVSRVELSRFDVGLSIAVRLARILDLDLSLVTDSPVSSARASVDRAA